MRNPSDLLLDGKCHQPFDFFRGQAGRFRDDLHDHTCDIGKRIDRNRAEGIEPHKGKKTGEREDQQGTTQRKLKEFVDHA